MALVGGRRGGEDRGMSASSEWEGFRRTAIELAGLGGRLGLQSLAQRLEADRLAEAVVERKRDDSPVTEADRAVQHAILREIERRHPDHAVYVEEHSSMTTRHAAVSASPYCWVVDPIDGTRNFARGMRMFATSVAMLVEGRPMAGAIFDANGSVMYSASAGGGAFADDRRLHVRDRPLGPDTTIAFSSFRRHPVPMGIRGLLDVVLFRNVGAACLHQVWVAAGLIDAIYAPDTKLWDIAAGGLIIAEAGGVVTDVAGRSCWPAALAGEHGSPCSIMAGAAGVYGVLAERASNEA